MRFYKLSQRPLGRYRMFPGIIRPEEQVNLSFRVDGRLIQFNAGSGKRFKKGDLLAKLDPAVFQAAVDSAEAKYQEALKDYERYKTLYGKKVVAATEYEKKKRDLDMSEAALRNAREDLRYSEIYAPFSGVTSTTYADTYQHIKANEPLIRLQNLDALQVSIDVPEKDFSVGIPNNITEVNRLAEENGEFNEKEVLTRLCDKLIFRHTHIFGNDKAASSEEALKVWEKNKAIEKGTVTVSDSMKKVAKSLPSLTRASKVQKRCLKSGLNFELIEDDCSFEDITEALKTASQEDKEKLLGKLLFKAASVSRECGIDPEVALNGEVERFVNRFEKAEKENEV